MRYADVSLALRVRAFTAPRIAHAPAADPVAADLPGIATSVWASWATRTLAPAGRTTERIAPLLAVAVAASRPGRTAPLPAAGLGGFTAMIRIVAALRGGRVAAGKTPAMRATGPAGTPWRMDA